MDLFILAFMIFAVLMVALMGTVFWFSIPREPHVIILYNQDDDDDDPGEAREIPDEPEPEGGAVDWSTFDKARNIWSTHTFSS